VESDAERGLIKANRSQRRKRKGTLETALAGFKVTAGVTNQRRAIPGRRLSASRMPEEVKIFV